MKLINFLPVLFFFSSCARQNSNNDIIPVSNSKIKDNIVNESFGDVGFHVFDHVHKGSRWHYQQVFAKRWRELNPSFVRLNDSTWNAKKLDSISWNAEAIKKFRNETDYVSHEVDNLEYLKKPGVSGI